MHFNPHYELEGLHAFLSPSKYHWVNYTPEKLEQTWARHRDAQMGTRLHEYAAESIRLGIKLPRTKKTLNMFVNDAIGFRMTPEQPLYFSQNCFGTADAIAFRKNFLRIHDLKNGVSPCSMMQLKIYAAIFCLEYNVDPNKLEGMELRIYQLDDILVEEPPADEIVDIMSKIIDSDAQIEYMKNGE